jgi:uncharacterized damage-inducible protein DinB
MSSGTSGDTTTITGERADLLTALAHARHFLTYTARDLDDDQARQRTTVSALTIGGLIKHVTAVEKNWAAFIVHGPSIAPDFTAKQTDELVAAVPDLDADHELPPAPWNPPGQRWSVRRTLLHIAAETAQHAGHADIIRESLDGAKSMG